MTFNYRKQTNESADDLSTCSFRVCSKCAKTRLLDFRATKKFPLGSYSYVGKSIRAVFTCEMLVKTTCDTPEDISKITMPDTLPDSWLIVDVSYEASLPTCAFFVLNNV